MKKASTKLLLLLLMVIANSCSYANNVRVGVSSFDAATKTLNLTLAWDNTWHDGSGTFRDAVWIFVKYKDITNAEWQHAILTVPTGTSSVIGDTLTGQAVKFELLGKNPTTGMLPAGARGMIVRRYKPLTGNLAAPEFTGVYNVAMNISVKIALPAGIIFVNPEFRVFALEMVDIPTSAFYVSPYGTHGYSPETKITSEAAITLNYQNDVPNTPNTFQYPAAFPKGFNEFYIMKYELSHEGYVEYLNTLSRAQQNLLDGNNSTVFDNLQTHISLSQQLGMGLDATATDVSTPIVFSCDDNNNDVLNEYNDGQCIAATTWFNLNTLLYLDWAALRPMTAFEYQKACRGPGIPVQGEYAWGTATHILVDTNVAITNKGAANETYSSNFNGPMIGYQNIRRCGIFAKPSGSNRLNTGGTFYGVMEMSGNATEAVILDNTSYIGTLGDGNFSSSTNDFGLSGIYEIGFYPISSGHWPFPVPSANCANMGIRGVLR